MAIVTFFFRQKTTLPCTMIFLIFSLIDGVNYYQKSSHNMFLDLCITKTASRCSTLRTQYHRNRKYKPVVNMYPYKKHFFRWGQSCLACSSIIAALWEHYLKCNTANNQHDGEIIWLHNPASIQAVLSISVQSIVHEEAESKPCAWFFSSAQNV
jgi:hypothetical protein